MRNSTRSLIQEQRKEYVYSLFWRGWFIPSISRKAWDARKPLKSLEYKPGLLREDHSMSQRLPTPGHGNTSQGNPHSVQPLARSQLCVMPKIFEGNYLLDEILLYINNSLTWQSLNACTTKERDCPDPSKQMWEMPINSCHSTCTWYLGNNACWQSLPKAHWFRRMEEDTDLEQSMDVERAEKWLLGGLLPLDQISS